MATIADVARLAGVGVGTVSRVINRRGAVSDSTRARVQDAITQLEYQPSPLARGLSLGRSSTIAVIVPFLTTISVFERIRGVVEVLSGSGFDPVLHHVETTEQRDAVLTGLAHRDRAAGAIAVSLVPSCEHVARFKEAGVPLVLLDAEADGVPSVYIDDVAGGRMATRHLVELGHELIAFAGDLEEWPDGEESSAPAFYRGPPAVSASAARRAGYEEALAEGWRAVRPDYVRLGSYSREVAGSLTRELLGLAEPPTAVFAASDTQAMGVLEAARDIGMRVPDDLSVVGFDDVEVARYVGLTTVRQPLVESGARSAELALRLIAGETGGVELYQELPLELVLRDTTRPPSH